MSRLSRPLTLPRWCVAIAVALFILFEAFAVYLAVLNHRISRELVSHRWGEPTLIVSAAGPKRQEITRLYGVGWRTTPPVTLDSLPRYVSDAFVAAEDVRFRHHISVHPIGMM